MQSRLSTFNPGLLNPSSSSLSYLPNLRFFSGFRNASSLDYTIYLENRNAVRISYVTDIYKTKGDVESLEVAQYALKIALLFNTK